MGRLVDLARDMKARSGQKGSQSNMKIRGSSSSSSSLEVTPIRDLFLAAKRAAPKNDGFLVNMRVCVDMDNRSAEFWKARARKFVTPGAPLAGSHEAPELAQAEWRRQPGLDVDFPRMPLPSTLFARISVTNAAFSKSLVDVDIQLLDLPEIELVYKPVKLATGMTRTAYLIARYIKKKIFSFFMSLIFHLY